MHALRRLAPRPPTRGLVSDESETKLRRPWGVILVAGVFGFYLAFRLVQMLVWLVRWMF